MKRIALLYHSGVGNTKIVAEKIHQTLDKVFQTEIYSVEKIPETFDINSYDGFVIGFPVIHTHPTGTILKFIKESEILSAPKPTYLFATCGLYSANSLRIFAKACNAKNFVPVLNRVFRGCPATDGILLAPFVKRFHTFPKDLDKKIALDARRFISVVKSNKCIPKIPRFKFYSILSFPNKVAGILITFPIHLHRQKCDRCNRCIVNCPTGSMVKDENGYPSFKPKYCEKCFRCIHHCPNLALSLSRKKPPQKVWRGGAPPT